MLAIADEDKAQEWTRLALGLIETADDPRTARWSGALHNNLGWALHDGGDPAAALDEFAAALAAYEATGTPEQQRIARWTVARCLRTLGRTAEALDIQLRVLESGPEDGYVSEELGELYLADGDPAGAARTSPRRQSFSAPTPGLWRMSPDGSSGCAYWARTDETARPPVDIAYSCRGIIIATAAPRLAGTGLEVDVLQVLSHGAQ